MSERILKAVKFATEWHNGVYRNSGQLGIKLPYIVHPIRVMDIVFKWGCGTEDNLCIAVGHDTGEDPNGRGIYMTDMVGGIYGWWEPLIGPKATQGIIDLTFLPNSQTKSGEAAEKLIYLDSFKEKPIGTLVVKVADRFTNVLDFSVSDAKYARKYYHKADPLFAALEARWEEIGTNYGVVALGKIQRDYNHIKAWVASNTEYPLP